MVAGSVSRISGSLFAEVDTNQAAVTFPADRCRRDGVEGGGFMQIVMLGTDVIPVNVDSDKFPGVCSFMDQSGYHNPDTPIAAPSVCGLPQITRRTAR